MVSTAIAGLPVCLSPIISSLCPLPIGIIESIAFIPVCKGTLTDLRSIIPDAGDSTGRVSVVFIAPLPSIGFPRASTTRPKSASPTGTSATRPVRFAILPSFIPVSSPRITTLTLSSSRFSAIDITPPSSSISSPAIHASSPCIRAIPSPTSIT